MLGKRASTCRCGEKRKGNVGCMLGEDKRRLTDVE